MWQLARPVSAIAPTCARPSAPSCSSSSTGAWPRWRTARLERLGSQPRVRNTRCRAAGGGDKPDDFESLFAAELKKRGISDSSSDDERSPTGDAAPGPAAPAASVTEPIKKAPFTPPPPSPPPRRERSPPPMSRIPNELDGQRERSFAMVNEGLEGLIPRGSQLLQLGASVFLGFLPFMLVFSLLFTGVWFVFGDLFIHGGREGAGPPPYVDPQVLLSNPTVDPYIPLR